MVNSVESKQVFSPQNIDWKTFADILFTAKIYE